MAEENNLPNSDRVEKTLSSDDSDLFDDAPSPSQVGSFQSDGQPLLSGEKRQQTISTEASMES